MARPSAAQCWHWYREPWTRRRVGVATPPRRLTCGGGEALPGRHEALQLLEPVQDHDRALRRRRASGISLLDHEEATVRRYVERPPCAPAERQIASLKGDEILRFLGELIREYPC